MDASVPAERGWVLEGAPAEVRSAERALRHVVLTRTVALGAGGVCVEWKDDPTDDARARVERRLGHPIEARANCDVARYPLGRGYVLILVRGAAEGLEDALDAEHPMYREIVRPASPDDPVRVCLPALSVGDPQQVLADLRSDGFDLLSAYEIGGCRR
jgi:hypothetical protein